MIELPTECLIKIFDYTYCQEEEKLDYVTLRSCSLVNRQWCATAVPMLWEEPLMNLQLHESTRDRIHLPITTYIMCLSDEAKTLLSKCGIEITPTLKRVATFDYSSFLQNLDNATLFSATEMWIEKCNIKGEQYFIPIYQVYQLIDQLLRKFMECCDNLKELRLKKSNQVRSPSDALLQLHLLPGAESSLTKLNKFSFDGCMQPEILLKASEISKNIQHLYVDCVCSDCEGLAKLIQVQQRPLLSLSIEAATFELPNLENVLKNKVGSLTSLDISRIFSLDIFSKCENLEKLVLSHNEYFSESLMENFVNSKFQNLCELQLHLDYPFLYQISTLIKNTNESLTSIDLDWIMPQDVNNFSLLIFTITMNCPNLKGYIGPYPNEIVRHYLPLFFEKCSKLEYFYIYDHSSTFYDISNIMKLIINVIPKNLNTMWLPESWVCNIESLNLFLKGCEERLSEPLSFFICYESKQHDEIIRKYIAKNVLTDN